MLLIVFVDFRGEGDPVEEVVVESFPHFGLNWLYSFLGGEYLYFGGIGADNKFAAVLVFEVDKIGNPYIVHDDISSLEGEVDGNSFEFFLEFTYNKQQGLLYRWGQHQGKGFILLILLDLISDFFPLLGHIFHQLLKELGIYFNAALGDEYLSFEEGLYVQSALAEIANCFVQPLGDDVDKMVIMYGHSGYPKSEFLLLLGYNFVSDNLFFIGSHFQKMPNVLVVSFRFLQGGFQNLYWFYLSVVFEGLSDIELVSVLFEVRYVDGRGVFAVDL